jgi:hypothetical protein
MKMRLSKLVLMGLVTTLVATAAASATGRYGQQANCPSTAMVQPFATGWGDTDSYFLAPGGSFEGSLTGWTVKGATVGHGNETYYVNSSKDRSSLNLPNGSQATSPSICVTTQTPDLRVFVRNTGSASATLNVNMTYTNMQGQPTTVTVGSLTGGASWSLSPQVSFLQNIMPLVNSNGQTWVTFTFAPVGKNGQWQVDDFYVDPIKSQHHK